MGLFHGHLIFAINVDICCSIAWLLMFPSNLPKIGHGMKFRDWQLLFVLIMLIPNSAYAMFEIKHLIIPSQLMPPIDTSAIIVFGGVSLFGLLTAVFGCRYLIKYYSRSKSEKYLYIALLSLILGFGGVVGLLDFASLLAIVFPPQGVVAAIRVRVSRRRL